MVSELKYYRSDPQDKDRGKGWYYYRGALKQPNGRRIRTWSKYDPALDAKRPHLPKKIDPEDMEKYQQRAPHKGDYKTRKASSSTPASRTVKVKDSRRPGRVVNRKMTRLGKGTRGFY